MKLAILTFTILIASTKAISFASASGTETTAKEALTINIQAPQDVGNYHF